MWGWETHSVKAGSFGGQEEGPVLSLLIAKCLFLSTTSFFMVFWASRSWTATHLSLAPAGHIPAPGIGLSHPYDGHIFRLNHVL